MTARLYLISPPALEPAAFAPRLTAALGAGDVGAFQLRMKDSDDADILAAGQVLMPICRARDVAFIVNDRADLAAELGADGAHLGQDDGSIGEARRRLGGDAVIGATCHDSGHLAMLAGEAGADYVAFGAFFPTKTKIPPTIASPDILKWWSEVFTLPCVAIGGITAENCSPLVQAGADFIAVSSYVWAHPDGPAAAVRALNDAIGKAGARP